MRIFIRNVLYSELIHTAGGELICYACSTAVNEERFKKYQKNKLDFATLKPTCSKSKCIKNPKIKLDVGCPCKSEKPFKDTKNFRTKKIFFIYYIDFLSKIISVHKHEER